jgi:hypoxanthine-guanine phosphoribosyltransferase
MYSNPAKNKIIQSKEQPTKKDYKINNNSYIAKQKFTDDGFVVGHGLDANERARQLKQIHDCFLEWNEREGNNRRKLGAVTPR